MPLWLSWLRDCDILNIFYDEFKIEKMAKFETLIATRGLKFKFKARRTHLHKDLLSCVFAAKNLASNVTLIIPGRLEV